MKKTLMKIFSLILCLCMFATVQISAVGPGDEGIMPLWDNTVAANCNIQFTTSGVGIVVIGVDAYESSAVINVTATLYRVRVLLSDVEIDTWTGTDTGSFAMEEYFTPEKGKKYRLELEATVSYGGYDEPISLSDTRTYNG